MELFKGLEYKLLDPWVIKKIEEEKRKNIEKKPELTIEDPELDPMPKTQDPNAPKRGVEYIGPPFGDDEEESKAYGVRI